MHASHAISKRQAAWKLSWDHIKVQYRTLPPYPNVMLPGDSAEIIYRHNACPSLHFQTSCCLETQLRSYTGTAHTPHAISKRHAAWRLSWDPLQVQRTPLTPNLNVMLFGDSAEIIYRYSTGPLRKITYNGYTDWRLSWYLQREAFPKRFQVIRVKNHLPVIHQQSSGKYRGKHFPVLH